MDRRTKHHPGSDSAIGARVRGGFVLLPLMAAVSACTVVSPPYVDESSIDPDGLYAGEPVAVHGTELPVTSAEEARVRARDALMANDVDLALYLYVQAVNLQPDDAESLFAIAAIHADRGNTDLATRAYAEVISLEPDNALAQQGLGLSHFEARRFEDAEPPLERAVEIDGTLWRAHNALGIIADRRQQYAAAVSHYTSAISAQPTVASVRNNRGYSKYLSGDLAAAKQDFLAALQIDPGYNRAWQNLGLVLAREQDYPEALEAMSHAIPEYVAMNDVGYIAMLDGNYQVAQSMFEGAVMLSPRHYQIAQDNLDELRRRRAEDRQSARVDNERQ